MKEYDLSFLIKNTLESISYNNKPVKVRLDFPIELSSCPCITYNQIGQTTTKLNTQGEKTRTFSYSIDIWAKDAISRSEIGEQVDNKLAQLKLRKTQGTDSKETDTQIYRRYNVFTCEVDLKKGIIYLGGL